MAKKLRCIICKCFLNHTNPGPACNAHRELYEASLPALYLLKRSAGRAVEVVGNWAKKPKPTPTPGKIFPDPDLQFVDDVK